MILKPESPHDANTLHRLLHNGHQTRDRINFAREQLAHFFQHFGNGQKQQRHADQCYRSQQWILTDHNKNQTNHGQQIAPQTRRNQIKRIGRRTRIMG